LVSRLCIQERSFEYTIKIDPLKVVSYTYKGQDSSIKIYPIELKEANTIKDVDDDSLAIENKTLHNFLEHNATTTYDGIFGFKENEYIGVSSSSSPAAKIKPYLSIRRAFRTLSNVWKFSASYVNI